MVNSFPRLWVTVLNKEKGHDNNFTDKEVEVLINKAKKNQAVIIWLVRWAVTIHEVLRLLFCF